MTTQRPLSAAAPASKAQPCLKWHSCLCAVAGPVSPRLATPSTSLPVHVLIANLELKLNLTHRKLNPLRISNRKFLTISRIAVSRLSDFVFAAPHPSLLAHPSLSNPRFRD